MSQEKRDKIPTEDSPDAKLGQDVYESAAKFNLQIATKGPAVLYGLAKASEPITNTTIVTGVGGMVLGAFGFFGNRYYRKKGDDSAYSYMGQLVGGVQFVAGFMLLTLKATEIYADSGEPNHILDVIKMAAVALTVTQGTLILVNSYLYSDGTPKTTPATRPKLD